MAFACDTIGPRVLENTTCREARGGSSGELQTHESHIGHAIDLTRGVDEWQGKWMQCALHANENEEVDQRDACCLCLLHELTPSRARESKEG